MSPKFKEYWNNINPQVIFNKDDLSVVKTYSEGAFDFCKEEILEMIKENHWKYLTFDDLIKDIKEKI